MADWVPVLHYMHRNVSRQYEYGIIQQISETTEYAIVYFTKTDESKHVHMSWNERIPHLSECVDHCTAFRVEVMVENSHIMTYVISVNPENFLLQIRNNHVLGEHHIISLIKNVWKNSLTHSNVLTEPTESVSHHDEVHCYTHDAQHVDIWDPNYILLSHQEKSKAYMKRVESQILERSVFEYNQHIDIPKTGWCLDIMSESFLTTPDMRQCKFRGAYLCDEAGSGKTVVTLKVISEQMVSQDALQQDALQHNALQHNALQQNALQQNALQQDASQQNYNSKATLIIVPINLPYQWIDEIERFYLKDSYTLVKLLKNTDLKNLDMHKLLNADIVITTLSFIRLNKTYNDIFNSVIASHVKGKNPVKKSRALFKTIARDCRIKEPILQIVNWRRIVVDELHEVKDKDLRTLKCMNASIVWGLTATPNLNVNTNDNLNDINFMFEELDARHPNMYQYFVNNLMKGHTNISSIPSNNLQLIQITDNEQFKIKGLTDEETILACTCFDDRVTVCETSVELEQLFVRTEEMKIEEDLKTLISLHKGIILTSIVSTALWCLEHISHSKLKRQKLIAKSCSILQDHQSIRSAGALLTVIKSTKRRKNFMEETLKKLEYGQEVCPICMERKCSVVTRCGHLFCNFCLSKHAATKQMSCPNCRSTGSNSDVFQIVTDDENSKLHAIKNKAISIKEPVIIFAQWKRVLKDLKILLKSSDMKDIYVLEGNVLQRKNVIQDFNKNGGILLLCATDSFAGIRLKNVKHVIFSHALLGDMNKVRSIEIQAIGRAIQQNDDSINVMSFVSANTQEEQIWRTNHPV